jgi:hypothetical protein
MVGARPPAARSFLVLRRTLILNLAVSARLGSCDFDLPRATRLSSYGLTSPPSVRLRRFPPPGLDDHGQTSRDETRSRLGLPLIRHIGIAASGGSCSSRLRKLVSTKSQKLTHDREESSR